VALQLLNPGPPAAQLVPEAVEPAQAPSWHSPVAQGQTSVPHWPLALHVRTPLPEHFVAPGEHTTQAPFRHTGVPPKHPTAFPQPPEESQGCTPFPEHCVCGGAHTPWQEAAPASVSTPPTHVWSVQVAESLHVPSVWHVSTPLFAHCVWPGPHTPVHELATHVVLALHALPLFCQVPRSSHVWGCCPLHRVAAGSQAAQAPLRHTGVLAEQGAPFSSQYPPMHSVGWAPLQAKSPDVHPASVSLSGPESDPLLLPLSEPELLGAVAS